MRSTTVKVRRIAPKNQGPGSGYLVFTGKVKNITQTVEKTSNSSYCGGRLKFRQKSSENTQYSGGAHRLEPSFTGELDSYEKYKENHQRCDWIEERMNSKRSETVLLNSFHKFNREKGVRKLEYAAARHEERADKDLRYARLPEARNHKKWHRNHPQDGFYQKRSINIQHLEEY